MSKLGQKHQQSSNYRASIDTVKRCQQPVAIADAATHPTLGTDTCTKGTGLGLSISQKIVEMMGSAKEHRPEIQVVQNYEKLPEIACFLCQLNQVLMI